MNKPTAALQIFKAGTHVAEDGRKLTFSEADVQQIADSYDPDLHEAPIVVGHPKTDLPAYGWGKTLSAQNGLLFAEPHQVDTDFAGMVNAGRFKKISASIFMPDSPGNPTPGKYYLRHIGFLGAQPPAVKGLKSAAFADGTDAVSFAMPLRAVGWPLIDLLQRLRDYFIDKEGLEQADQIIPQWQIRSIDDATRDDDDAGKASLSYAAPTHAHITPESEMSEATQAAQFAEREQALSQQASTLDAREKTIAAREATARREDVAAFAEGLVTAGKLLPRNKAPVIELLLALPAGDKPLNFADGDTQVTKPADQVLRDLLDGMPKVVDFAEKSASDGSGAQISNFAAPAGINVDASNADLYARAKTYQAGHPTASWVEAVSAVGG
ncbi:hypothetical protein KWH04_01130 [Xanthomonas campestris pv. trichodesmae]|uniref:Peptidase n=2 Tax=Xanthomonas citri TaxID=346 RepID=A0AB33CJX8_XANCI|nr:peptidase [Xanthomonas citri]ASK91057.1 peptidase [Xanthomonas citri pv. vignicola]MBV6779273.1 hypothetical protein [Xanthomonas campestris pv. trichodesmae]MBZ3921787.1 hypothetical protein [Xanthomonas campestris pv. trichodesmae]MBZ3926387.1 hypothetical protein [Xanthomonas citri pv. sesbaniae]